jgi:hypothetical protein
MKKATIAIALFILPTAACKVPQRPVTDGNVTGSFFEGLFGKRCDLEILFGSYASGIDGKIHGKITALLTKQGDKITSESKNWGREGEKAVCIDVKSERNAAPLEKEITAIIAANSPAKGPVTVTRGPKT